MNAPCPPFPPYPPFPANPTVGQRFGSWVWNGTQWVVSPVTGIQIVVQVFNHVGQSTYMPSPGLMTAIVECVGGGGGGGGALSQYIQGGAAGWLSGAGGGASGGYSKKMVPAALVIGGVSVTIGAGGTAGTGSPLSAGGTGGITSFGAFCIANGGGGGQAANFTGGATSAALLGGGGAKAAIGIGDILSPGNAGHSGFIVLEGPGSDASVWGGYGGPSFWGGSGQQMSDAPASPPPQAGVGGTGAGGAGGASTNSVSPASGAAGGAGSCVVTEFCWLLSAQGGGDCGARVPITDCGPEWGEPC